MSFEKWMKTQCKSYNELDNSMMTQMLRMAYEAGERQGRKDAEDLAKNNSVVLLKEIKG